MRTRVVDARRRHAAAAQRGGGDRRRHRRVADAEVRRDRGERDRARAGQVPGAVGRAGRRAAPPPRRRRRRARRPWRSARRRTARRGAPSPRHRRCHGLEQVLHEERRAQEGELEPRVLDELLAAPVGRRGRRGAVRPERGRAAGDLDDPAHAGRRGRVDRRCLEEVLVGHVRREQQEPLDAVAALPAACRDAEGRRGRPSIGRSTRSGSRTSARAADAGGGQPAGDVAADAPGRSEDADHRAAPVSASSSAAAPGVGASPASPQANTNRSGRSSAQRQPAPPEPGLVGARVDDP